MCKRGVVMSYCSEMWRWRQTMSVLGVGRVWPKSEIWRGRERMVCAAQGAPLAPKVCRASQDCRARKGNAASLDRL